MYVGICMHVYVCMYMCVYVCVYVCVYMYACICIHVCIYVLLHFKKLYRPNYYKSILIDRHMHANLGIRL